MASDFPKVRHGLEAMPVDYDGKRMILLRDRLGYCSDSLLISPQLAALVGQMNGGNSLRDLQAYHMRCTGELLYSEQLNAIVDKLDEHLFLENERFLEAVSEALARFRGDPVKRMQFAGKSYPEDPDSLRTQLQAYFMEEPANSPDMVEGARADGKGKRLVGLVAPHIDIQAGGTCFARAYQAVGKAVAPETWVVLGTGHEPLENYFALTCKDFETPIGMVRHDRECCELIRRLASRDILAAEFTHQREHTVEFQAVFLAYVQPNATIVPMLCSFSPEEWEKERGYLDEMAEIIWDLSRLVGRPVGIIASVDLAHIGPRYGDASRPHQGTISDHIAADRILLDYLIRCDAAGFMEKVKREENRRRICGISPLYIMARAVEGKAYGEVLHHTYATVDQLNSFVTFAGMAFYAGDPEAGRGESPAQP